MRQELKNLKKIVIKVGTNLITSKNGEVNTDFLNSLVKQILNLKKEKDIQVVVVSSGAIGLGRNALKIGKSNTLPEKQAAAAVGQGRLMHLYNTLFEKVGLITAQILMTQDDFRNRLRYINARNTLNTLLAHNVIPIVNENDTISVDEIKFGDNDVLAAYISNLIEADLLVILTSVDGLMDLSQNKLIKEVSKIDKDVESLICNSKTDLGTGGMFTKINAAKIVKNCGSWMVIANGNEKDVILKILNNENVGTLFKPLNKKINSKKRWIAFNKKIKGEVFVDTGASKAIVDNGKSLLPIGVVKIVGSFQEGDLVSIKCEKEEIARGITNYSSEQLDKIKRLSTSQIEEIFKKDYYIEVVHRDNMVVSCLE